MTGLLGDSMDDPRTMAVFAGIQGLLGGRGLQGVANGLLSYGSQMQEAKKQAALEEERKQRAEAQALQMQQQQFAMEQAKKQAAMEDRKQQFIQNLPSPTFQAGVDALGAAAQGGVKGPTLLADSLRAQVDPQQEQLLQAVKANAMPYEAYLASQRKDTSPQITKAGDIARDPRTGRIIWQNPAEGDKLPEAIRVIENTYGANSPQAIKAKQDYVTKLTTHQPGTNVNVNTAKPFMTTLAEGLGKQVDASLETARSSVQAIQTAHSIKAAVDSGKVIAGPGATFRVAGLQLGQTLGIGGKDAAETLANTRSAIQSMAQTELNAAAQMKGQGQITEAERALLKRAASGDIDGLTAPEIRQLADIQERAARYKIQQHRSNTERLRSMPEAAPLMQFYNVDEPAIYEAPSATRVRKWNPATGKLEG